VRVEEAGFRTFNLFPPTILLILLILSIPFFLSSYPASSYRNCAYPIVASFRPAIFGLLLSMR
jgi:hypothetical protein